MLGIHSNLMFPNQGFKLGSGVLMGVVLQSCPVSVS